MSNHRKDLLERVLNSSCVEELLIYYDLVQGSDWNYLEFFSILEYLIIGWSEFYPMTKENMNFYYSKLSLFLDSLEITKNFDRVLLSDTFIAFVSSKVYSWFPREMTRITHKGVTKAYRDFITYENYRMKKFLENLKNRAETGK